MVTTAQNTEVLMHRIYRTDNKETKLRTQSVLILQFPKLLEAVITHI
jgi:hypothetical protein